jgi:DnaJ-class molecular chaperone
MELSGDRRIEVKIPPGVDNASKVHIPAGGGKDAGFNLVISVQPHQAFQRKGRDLYRDIDVSVEDAILGAEVTVPTLSGRVALTIPPETQSGQRFRMARQGMPGLNQTRVRGDLYATVKVILPTGLTTEEKDLIWQLRESRASRGG